jgi:hypothetical protein
MMIYSADSNIQNRQKNCPGIYLNYMTHIDEEPLKEEEEDIYENGRV